MRVHIFVDQDAVKPITYGEPRLTVCTVSGEQIGKGKKIHLNGRWTLRQYNNPVPCGATVVLYPEGEASYEVASPA